MDTIDRVMLQRLVKHSDGPCVTLFFETHPVGKDGEQDAIRLKNLLGEAERRLSGHWMRAAVARDLLNEAGKLPDSTFWRSRSNGLAVFVARDLFEAYRVSVPFAELVVVANKFRVRPLLPLLEQNLSFFLLSISENKVALNRVDEQSIEEMVVPGLPTSLSESLNYAGADRGSQVHSATRAATGKQAAVFHGQGGQPDRATDDRLAFCGEVDKAVSAWLGQSTRPLLLACVERLAVLYRRRNSYKHLLDQTSVGNHDYDRPHELRIGAWQVVKPLLRAEATKVADRYDSLLGTQSVSDDPREVVIAALQGRVDSLLYYPKAGLYGEYESAGNVRVTGSSDDDDLIDLAAAETLRHGGTIHALTEQDVSTKGPLAAILRY